MWERNRGDAVASDSGDVTTYRPEHVVNRADRLPWLSAHDKIRKFDNRGLEDAGR